MPGTVIDMTNEGFGFSQLLQNGAGDAEVGVFISGTEVVNLPRSAVFEGCDQSEGTILDVDPVADLLAGAVDGEGLVAHGVINESGDELFPVLARSVVIRAASDDDILKISGVSRDGEKVGAGLGGGVGRRGAELGEFVEFLRKGSRAIDFVSGALKKGNFEESTYFQQGRGPEHISEGKLLGACD